MLKKLFNEFSFDLIIDAVDPIIIKSGKASVTGPDDNPVKTWRSGKEEAEPFIPGSSLKGVFRSHIENVVRTEKEELGCLPYLRVKDARKEKIAGYYISCGEKFQQRMNEEEWGKKKEPPTELVYRESCPICKLFGSTFFKGRIAISDAYVIPDTPFVLEERDGVAIDRFTGGAASGALFQVEVVAKARFNTRIKIQNFECWQLGMMAIVMNDLDDELIQIGSGATRGFGRIKGTVENTTLRFFRKERPDSEIWGLGRFLKNEGNENYGTDPADLLTLDNMPEGELTGIWKKYELSENVLKDLKDKAINDFYEKLSTEWTLPTSMRFRSEERRVGKECRSRWSPYH